MALSDAQKAEIRRFMGFTDVEADAYHRIEGVMLNISAEGESQVTQILTDLTAIEAALRSSWGCLKVSGVEDISLAGMDGIAAMRSEGNRLARQLAIVFGVPINFYPFMSASSVGIGQRG